MDTGNPRSGEAKVRGDSRPTLKTIAFMTGLGVTTVSRALKDAPEIGEATRRRVQLVAQQVGYRPNRAGVRLRTGKTNVISLVLNTEEQIMGFVSDIIYGISETLAQTPYHLIVTPYSRQRDPMEPVRYVVETGSADGIIISRTEPDDPRVRYMTERGFPFATHGRTDMGVTHPFHDFDNHAFALEAVRKLAAKGRSKLALLAPPSPLTYHHHTVNGFSDGLIETGASAIPFNAINIDNSIDQIRAHTAQLMQRRDRPDGIVSSAGAATLALVCGNRGCRADGRPRRRCRVETIVETAAPLPAGHPGRQRGFPPWRGASSRVQCSAGSTAPIPQTLQSLSIPTEVEAFRRPQDDRRLAAAQTA